MAPSAQGIRGGVIGRPVVYALALAVALATCAVIAGIVAFSTSNAVTPPKGVNGFFGSTTGAAGGQLNTSRGIAVDQANGNVYTADSSNNRISVFSSSGAFLRAFGQDVVASGPGDNGTGYEICVAASGDVCKVGITTASTGGGMQAPQGVSLDSSGNVYVSESTKRRVQKFDSNGAFLLAFGQDVVASGPGSNGTGYEICVAASGDVCKAGITPAAPVTGGAFGATVGYLTVAPAGAPNEGNLLVADAANLRVQEFTPAGAFVRAFGFDAKTGGVTTFEVCELAAECKVGVTGAGVGQFANSVNRIVEDADGNIYTVESATNFRVQKFTLPLNVVTPQGNFSEANTKGTAAANGPLDVAIDPATKNVLVSKAFAAGAGTPPAAVAERRVLEISPAGSLEGTHMINAGINTVNGIAVRSSAATGDVYVSSTTEGSRLYVLNTPLAVPSVGFNGISSVSAHSATASGFVNPNGPASLPYGLRTGYHFAYKRSADATFTNLPGVDADAGRGTVNQLVSVTLPGLEAGTSYDVQLVATKPFGAGTAATATFSFTTSAAGAEVGIPSATTAATATGARAALWGSVSPNSQATTYRFEYGPTASYGTKVPAPDGSAGSGAAAVPVAQFLDSLQPGTTYHFRLVAKNAIGSAVSPDRTFTTPPHEGGLPNDRAAELVSPADKGTQGSVADFGIVTQLSPRTAENGNSFAYPLQNGIDPSTAGGWLRQLATRTPGGWLSTQLSAPSLIPPPRRDQTTGLAVPSRILSASPDLSCGLLETYNPLTADTPQLSVELGIYNLYRWTRDGDYELISNRVPLNSEELGGLTSSHFFSFETSDDCSRVYFRSFYELIDSASGLYEWDEGTLRDAGVLPNGAVGAGAVMGGEATPGTTGRWDAVSPDGSRLFFSAISNAGPDIGKRAVFMREDGGAEVVDISQSQTAIPASGARFEAASPDGSHVFFRANYGIAGPGSAGPTDGNCGVTDGPVPAQKVEVKPCDLYGYNVETGELTDLSADTNPADAGVGAQVQGTVAISDDGSHVYFAALGQLIPGKGRTYAENVAGNTSANIYLAHGGELSYVTMLGQYGPDPGGGSQAGDLLGSGGGTPGSALMRLMNSWSASTSADGRKLLFASSRNLTGYESGGVYKKDAYLYSADTGQITCVSCRLDGLPSLVLPNEFTPEFDFIGNQSTWLLASGNESSAYKPRSMSEDGSRIFFSSPNPLAPGAVAGKRNVYQWENGQVRFLAIAERSGGNGFGEYFDASASGDDVFIATREQLAPQDIDFVSDVYDLRVGGGFAPEVEPVACQVNEGVPLIPNQVYCQGDPNPPPPTQGSASAGFQGSGNPPPPVPCPRGKVRRHGKCVKKPTRKGGKHRQRRAANSNRGGAK